MKSFVFPGNIESEILAIAARQIPYMRTKWFSDLVLESESMLLDLFDCPNGKIIPYTASGTAAMDSCISCFVSTCKKSLVVNGGTFGARWGELCEYYRLPHDVFMVEFGKDPDWKSLENTVCSGKYDVLLMQHHETSSGYLYDVNKVGQLCRENGLFFIVDAIGSFLTDQFSMKNNCADVAVVSSQKGLNLPPGLSFLVISERVLQSKKAWGKHFYYDWAENLNNLRRGQTPYSPATQLFIQLYARLQKIQQIGRDRLIGNVREKAEAFRNACENNGWQLSAERKSNCLTGVYLPFSVRPFVNALIEKEIYIMPSARENMIRVTHTGTLQISDHIDLIGDILRWIKMENA